MEDVIGNAPEGEPSSVSVRHFVAARVKEIASLTSELRVAQSGSQGRTKGFSFQHVSKHMRRRAVSHNPKRIPSRLRQSHLSQLRKSGGIVKAQKRPSRKYRKRAEGNILEFNRRQLTNPMWLESHVWHAKRFHMQPKWDKKLPIAPTAKCFRSLFRAAQNRVIMQDISYLACLELVGPEQLLLSGLNQLAPFGFGIYNKRVSHVNEAFSHELPCHIYSLKAVYIGTIRCLWVPCEDVNEKLIIWAHPALSSQLIEELAVVFGLEEEEKDTQMLVDDLPVPDPNNVSKDEKKYSWKVLMNRSWRNQETHVSLNNLGGTLNRIRLTGPRSLPVLKEILKVDKLTIQDLTNKEEMAKEEQESVWNRTKYITAIPSNTVLPLNVKDPRLELPIPRRPPQVSVDSTESIEPFTPLQQSQLKSHIWDDNVRRQLLHSKLADTKLAEIRSRNLIPGTEIQLSEETNVIPVVLVFRAGHHSKFVGIDLIVPYGWLMPFWVALSYRCVRAYGLEFNDYLTFEQDPFLLDLNTSTACPPDSVVYSIETGQEEVKCQEKFYSRPPAKRHNLIKLGCAFPFSVDWNRFLKSVADKENATQSEVAVKVIRGVAMSSLLDSTKLNDFAFSDCDLIPVQLVLLSGTVSNRAGIYLPTKEDLQILASKKSSKSPVAQMPLVDINEEKRTELNRQHQKRLAKLRKKRKVARKAASSKSFDLGQRLDTLDSTKECSNFDEKMKKLWLNEDVETVISQQDREMIGLVTYGHYSFFRGKSAGLGYVSVGQLRKLFSIYDNCELQKSDGTKCVQRLRNHVLVRNWESSLTYNWAKLLLP